MVDLDKVENKYIIKKHWKENLYRYYLNDGKGEVNTHSLILVTM